MANRGGQPLNVPGTRRWEIKGAFQPNGAGAPLNVKGLGYTVAHAAGTADFVVTLTDQWVDFESFEAQVHGPTLGIAADIIATPDVAVTKQFTIRLYDTAAKTSSGQNDLANNANLWVTFAIRLKNTTVVN